MFGLALVAVRLFLLSAQDYPSKTLVAAACEKEDCCTGDCFEIQDGGGLDLCLSELSASCKIRAFYAEAMPQPKLCTEDGHIFVDTSYTGVDGDEDVTGLLVDDWNDTACNRMDVYELVNVTATPCREEEEDEEKKVTASLPSVESASAANETDVTNNSSNTTNSTTNSTTITTSAPPFTTKLINSTEVTMTAYQLIDLAPLMDKITGPWVRITMKKNKASCVPATVQGVFAGSEVGQVGSAAAAPPEEVVGADDSSSSGTDSLVPAESSTSTTSSTPVPLSMLLSTVKPPDHPVEPDEGAVSGSHKALHDICLLFVGLSIQII
eukprot:Blabericola_migrator_1__719@NODE_1179_length_5202_cov_117_032717_g802_i0_p2_GENE_NODE_1179_length_5202_cov_117_032717_g802_i0NODE_1179_length_5202_cov_117_032717_g802_i0_p2_ORF_typecomplete_len324_score50_72Podoplanin/PF05808_11/0_32Podoplanin/PF05808_11/62_NODE_1179_length_5202_cov_117_032717_g802_i032634234